jgi:hypothetical protein
MYQPNATEARTEHRAGPPEGSEKADRPYRRLHVVRAPGGFAFVEDEPDTQPRGGERGGAAMC